MLERLRFWKLIQPQDTIIDFDSNSGLYGLALAKASKAKKVIALDNAPILLQNVQFNAKNLELPCDIVKGCDVNSLAGVLQQFHYNNDPAVVILHPKGTLL